MSKQRFFELLQSFRFRLVLSYLFVVLLSVVLASGLGLYLIHAEVVAREDESLALYAELARNQVLPLLGVDQPPLVEVQAAVERIARLSDLRVKVLSPGGEVMADSGHPATLAELQRVADQMARQGDMQVVIRDEAGSVMVAAGSGTETVEMVFSFQAGLGLGEAAPSSSPTGAEGKTPIYIQASPARSKAVKTLPVTIDGNNIAMVEVSEGPRRVGETMDQATRAFQTAAWIALIVSLLVGIAAAIRLYAPLVKLSGAVDRMQAGDLSARAPVQGGDEINRLGVQFNAMAERLEDSFHTLQSERDSLRRFVGDASHELRTPVTALQMFAELLENPDCNPQERAEYIAEIQTQTNRLAWITNNLLDLSRMDAGIVQLALEVCPAADVLHAAAHALQARAQERGVELQVSLPSAGLALSCDRPRLEMALTNLLENAIKYTPRGGCVQAGATVEAGSISFWVKDNGPGIAPDDLPHIFERFYRGRDRRVPGSGLGLPIVKGVAELHGGEVYITSQPGQGALAVVKLPLKAQG